MPTYYDTEIVGVYFIGVGRYSLETRCLYYIISRTGAIRDNTIK